MSWCLDRAESTGDARYCGIARTLEFIAHEWDLDSAFLSLRRTMQLPLHNMDEILYDSTMSNVKQVAFQIDTESLAAIDALTPSEFSSRAEIIRVAVHDWLARRRADAVDAALAKGYGISPQGDEEDSWAERSLEGLEAANLAW